MPYYQDLTPYEYMRPKGSPPGLNVGWLSIKHPFSKGIVSAEAIAKLKSVIIVSTNVMRGYQNCEFCPRPSTAPRMQTFQHASGVFHIGSAEIWVTSSSGICYVAPNLIIHYIEAHQYLPPEEFIQAVLQMPLHS